MIKQITTAIVGLLGISFLIDAISTLARSTHSISSEATISDYLFIYAHPIILFIAAVLCIRYRDTISSWLNKNTSNDGPTDVNMDKLECLAYRVIGILTLISTTPFFIMSYSNYFIKPMASVVGANVTRYAAVQFIAALINFSLSLILIIIPNRIQSLLKKTRGY